MPQTKTIRFLYLYACLFFLGTNAFAQVDSTALQAEQLDLSDIKINTDEQGTQQVISAMRRLESVDDLPFTIYVITKEEILQNGYVTLVDALKMIPGIRVSQPGSALEGELFMMHGLKGNRYAKILVDGLPIKPLMAAGMPIGAQLPIRQAERIEVIYGPGAALYGTDANAGIINIVLKENERPIYTQADLAIGPFGYNQVDVMVGGKLGKGKQIIKFKAWGSSTSFSDWNLRMNNIYSGNSAYNIHYPDTAFLDNPNYVGRLFQPEWRDMPHQSRQFGMHFNYRRLNFGIDHFYRRDHAALGSNPLHISYSNSGTYRGEDMTRLHLNFSSKDEKKDKRKNHSTSENQVRKWKYILNTSILLYEMDAQSSANYIESNLRSALERKAFQDLTDNGIVLTPAIRADIRDTLFQRIFEGERYQLAYSLEPRIEQMIAFQANKHLEFSTGLNVMGIWGQYELGYFDFPAGDDVGLSETNNYLIEIQNPLKKRLGGTDSKLYLLYEGFAEAHFNYHKFKANIGVQAINWTGRKGVNPRAGLLFTVNPSLNLRFNYAKAFRLASPYFGGQTYFIDSDLEDKVLPALSRTASNLVPEITTSFQLGMRWKPKANFHLDAFVFYNQTDNLIAYTEIPRINISNNPTSTYLIGYTNFAGSFIQLAGLQTKLTWRKPLKINKLTIDWSNLISTSTALTPLNVLTELEDDYISEYPNWLAQLRLSYKANDFWHFAIEGIYGSKSYSKSHIDLRTNEKYELPDALRLDAIVHYNLTDNFRIYTKCTNLLGALPYGISASGTTNDLIYNIPAAQRFHVAASYRLE